MRKPLILLALASVAVIVACNKTQLIQPPPEAEAITFRPLMNGMTKATPKTDFSENDPINVWATMGSTSPTSFFNNVTFTYTGSGFTSTPVYYWPSTISAENSLNFYASSGVVQTAAGVFSFTPQDGAEHQTDLLVSKQSVTAKPASAPALTFKHALTQIEVKVMNGNSAVLIEISGVKLGYVATTGSCNFTSGTPVWSITNPTGPTVGYTQLLNPGHLSDVASAMGGTAWMIVPQNLSINQSGEGAMHYSKAYTDATHTEPDGNPRLACAYVALKLAFSNNAGNFAPIVAQQWCYWPISINLEAGKKYTFVIDAATGGYQPGNVDAAASTDLDRVLAGLAIEFGSPTVETWVTDLNSDTENNDDIPVIM